MATVDTLPLESPLSVEDFMESMRLSDDSERDAAEQYLRAAVRTVEGRCGELLPREVTIMLPEGHGGRYWHTAGPVLSAAGEGARVSPIGVVTGIPADATAVTLRVGREPVPDDLVLAVFFLGSHLWEMRRGRSGRPGAYARGDDGAPPTGFAIPRRSLELMADHLLPGMA